MKQILFVDDETSVLSGLKRMLRNQRSEWDMTFVESGQAALGLLESRSFDVVVSDMRMPGMDGASLLTYVRDTCPGAVRIVLSGQSEPEAALRAVPVAHQFLSKPCDSEVVRAIISRACDLQDLLTNPAIRDTVGKLKSLPAVPRIYNELNQLLADPEVSLDDVAAVVEQDIGVTAKVLQVVHSSFFGIARRVESVRQATTYLGTGVIRQLVLSVETFRAFSGKSLPAGCSLEREQVHATLTSRIAKELIETKHESECAQMAAMFHDMGKLVMATSMPEMLKPVLASMLHSNEPRWVLEQEAFGFSHAELGAYLLGIWGLPHDIVEAVAHHHNPSRVEVQDFGCLSAVHVADGLLRELVEPESTSDESPFDMDHLEAVGVVDMLPTWRKTAAAIVSSVQSEAA